MEKEQIIKLQAEIISKQKEQIKVLDTLGQGLFNGLVKANKELNKYAKANIILAFGLGISIGISELAIKKVIKLSIKNRARATVDNYQHCNDDPIETEEE